MGSEYFQMTHDQQRLAWAAMLRKAARGTCKQMTNKQILMKYFTQTGRLKP